MKIFILSFFIILSTGLSSQEVTTSLDQKNNLVLTGTNCMALAVTHKHLCQWKREIDPSFDLSIEKEKVLQNNCKKITPQKFTLTVSECLPDFVKMYQQKKLYDEGANCWGTAMSFKQISPLPRFIWSQEMEYWMNSPMCRKLAPKEMILPGDIMNVYGPESIPQEDWAKKDEGNAFFDTLYPGKYKAPSSYQGNYTGFHRILHSETYVSFELTFGKDSPNKKDRFQFHSIRQVYGRPKEDNKECQENQTMVPHLRTSSNEARDIKNSYCAYFTSMYRCGSFKDYFSKVVMNPEDQETWKNVQSLQGLNEKLFSVITDPAFKLEKCEHDLLLNLSQITMQSSLDKLKKSSITKEQEMLYTMEYFAAAAIKKTLHYATSASPE